MGGLSLLPHGKLKSETSINNLICKQCPVNYTGRCTVICLHFLPDSSCHSLPINTMNKKQASFHLYESQVWVGTNIAYTQVYPHFFFWAQKTLSWFCRGRNIWKFWFYKNQYKFYHWRQNVTQTKQVPDFQMHLKIYYDIKCSQKVPTKKSRVHKVLFFMKLQGVSEDTFLHSLPSLYMNTWLKFQALGKHPPLQKSW